MLHSNMDLALLSLPLQTIFKIPIPNRDSCICSHPGGEGSSKLLAQFSREWRNMQRQGVGLKKELPNDEGPQRSDLREADPVDPLASSLRSKNSNSWPQQKAACKHFHEPVYFRLAFVRQWVAEAPDQSPEGSVIHLVTFSFLFVRSRVTKKVRPLLYSQNGYIGPWMLNSTTPEDP